MLSEKEFVEIAKLVEIHIQNNNDYKACIGMGYYSTRFIEAYRKYLSTIAQQPLSGSADAPPKCHGKDDCPDDCYGRVDGEFIYT